MTPEAFDKILVSALNDTLDALASEGSLHVTDAEREALLRAARRTAPKMLAEPTIAARSPEGKREAICEILRKGLADLRRPSASASTTPAIDASCFRVGDELWLETEHAMVMIPADTPERANLPPQAIHDDRELAVWVADLRSRHPGPELEISVDEEKRTAHAGRLPFPFEAHTVITSLWKGRAITWHVQDGSLNVVHEKKIVAKARLAEGVDAQAMLLVEMDGAHWAISGAMAVAVPKVQVPPEAQDRILREGEAVDHLREMLARPLGPAEGLHADGEAVWVGPARLQQRLVNMIHALGGAGLTWHASGAQEPVIAARDGKPVAIVMPWIQMTAQGGQA